MSPFISRSLLALCGTLSLAAQAGAQTQFSPLTMATPAPTAAPVSQRQFAEAAVTQISLLSSLRDWRETMRGSGKLPTRNFKPKPLGKNFGFSLGQVAPPIVGSGAGLAASFSGIEVGTTAQPMALTDALNHFDAMMTGDKVAVTDATQMTWLRAKPIQTKDTNLELSMSRGRRDTLAGVGENWLDGSFQNARLRMNLPARWTMTGEFTREQLKTQDQAEQAWNVNASGPIEHPFGVAQATVTVTDVAAGYATLADPNPVVGQKKGEVQVTQGVAIGPVSGNVVVAANKRERPEDNAKTGDEIEGGGTRSQAQMRLAVTPNLALISSGSAQFDNLQRALQDQTSSASGNAADDASPDTLLSPSQARELNQQFAGDVGVEWKFSKALSLAVTTGSSRVRAQREIGQNWDDAPGSDENRRAIELRHKTSAADLRIRLAQRARCDLTSTGSSIASDISQWRVEAARRLIGSVSLKTIVDVARDDKSDADWHQYEAQVQLAKAARLDARYRDGTLAPGLISNEWSSTFAAPDTSARQWSARFNAGSAATGTGLGMAVEYARSAGSNPDQWRIGLQFK